MTTAPKPSLATDKPITAPYAFTAQGVAMLSWVLGSLRDVADRIYSRDLFWQDLQP